MMPEAARHDRDDVASSPGRRCAAWSRARPTASAIVESAARSCSPRNERLPAAGAADEADDAPATATAVYDDDQLGERRTAAPRRRGTRRRRASARRARRASGRGDARRRRSRSRSRRSGARTRAVAASSQRRRQRTAAPRAAARRARPSRAARRRPGRPRRSCRPTPTSTLGRSRARSRHSTTVTRKTEKERSLAGRRSALKAGWASGETMIGAVGPVRGAPVDAHAHRLPHRNLAAGRRRPCDARAGLRAVPRRARPPRPRRHDGRRRAGRAALRGRGRLAPARRFPLRYGAGGAARARAARAADVVYATATYAAAAAAASAGAAAARREARLRPGLRARAALRALRRARSRSSSARRAGRCAALKAARTRALRAASDDRRPERVPRRDRARLGLGGEPDPRAARTPRRRHATSSPSSSSRAPSSSSAGSRARRPSTSRSRRSPACRPRGSSSSETGPNGPARAPGSSRRRALPGSRSVGAALPRRGAARRRRRRGGRCSRATGRTCRTPRSRRFASACRSSRRPSAACPRSCTTARTGCSCRPATRRRSRQRSGACSRSPACATGLRRRRSHRSRRFERGRLRPLEALLGRRRDERAAAARPLRRTRPLPAAAAGLAGEEVGRGRAGARLPRPRRGGAGVSGPSDERFRLVAPARPRRLDGAPLLPAPAAAGAAPRSRVPAGGDLRVRSRSSARRRSSGARLRAAAAPVIVEVHGDWRTFTRLYGSPARRLLARSRTRVAASRSGAPTRRGPSRRFTAGLVEDVRGRARRRAVFTAFSDLSAFAERAAGSASGAPTALFVGALEAYKNVDGLAAAWRLVADRLPEAALVIVGSGSQQAVVDELVRGLARPRRAPRVARARGGRGSARRRDGARAAVVAGGPRPGRSSSRSPAAGRWSRRTRAASPTSSTTGSRACSCRRRTRRRSRPRSTACSPTGSSRSGSARRPGRYARLALDARGARGEMRELVDRARRNGSLTCGSSSSPRRVDADHPVLAQTRRPRRALAARCE